MTVGGVTWDRLTARERFLVMNGGRPDEPEPIPAESLDLVPAHILCDEASDHSSPPEFDRLLTLLLAGAGHRLNQRHRMVIELRMKGMTLDAVGDVLGVSRERVRQMEVKAHRMLRNASYEGRLRCAVRLAFA
jgi:DNA-directed RNA polymerase sigma subunit (sigma70/sigma32)